jgi:hypothetical protein
MCNYAVTQILQKDSKIRFSNKWKNILFQHCSAATANPVYSCLKDFGESGEKNISSNGLWSNKDIRHDIDTDTNVNNNSQKWRLLNIVTWIVLVSFHVSVWHLQSKMSVLQYLVLHINLLILADYEWLQENT